MEIIRTYSDLVKMEEALEDQISITKHELYMWYGIDIDNDVRFFGGNFAMKHGLNPAVKQADERLVYLSRLMRRLDAVRLKKRRLKEFVDSLESLDGQIAFKRIAEHKTHKEIAEELGYSIRQIERRWAAIQDKQTV